MTTVLAFHRAVHAALCVPKSALADAVSGRLHVALMQDVVRLLHILDAAIARDLADEVA